MAVLGKKILLLVHPQMRPDSVKARTGTERDVWATLRRLGFQVSICAAQSSLKKFEKEMVSVQPDIVFNLLEEFRDEGVFDFHLVSHLESAGVPFTGCNPRGLIVSRNKFWCMQVAAGCSVPVPESTLVRGTQSTKNVSFPAFVKFNREHASLGITKHNKVDSQVELKKTLKRMAMKFSGEILVQSFKPGKDVTVAVLGNDRPRAFPPWCLHLPSTQAFATERVKFSSAHRFQQGIRARAYSGPHSEKVVKAALELYRILDLSGYGRFDFRIDEQGFFLVDVNANPNLARGEDVAASALRAGLKYEDLVLEILRLAESYSPRV